MKKILLGAALLMISTNCPAETKQALTLHLESGESIVYFLDTRPSIGFKGQTMVVNVENETSDIPMQDVNHWEIGMVEFSGINIPVEATGAPEVNIVVFGNTLTVHNPDAKGIAIFNMSGQIVSTSNNNDANFTLKRGIYVIKIENNTYKIAIR